MTPQNIVDQPIQFEVEAEIRGDMATIRVFVKDGIKSISSCRKAELQLGEKDDVRLSCNVEGYTSPKGRLTFRISVRRDIVSSAIFTFKNFSCEFPSFDGYRMRFGFCCV